MERLIRGDQIKNEETCSGNSNFFDFSVIVRKGHAECGDSAFVYHDDKKAILGVFDGVSGEAGAASASSEAAECMLNNLKAADKADEKVLKKVFLHASAGINKGYTTSSLLFAQKNGAFILASVGDSPIYSVNRKGKICLELPLARVVGDKTAIFKFFSFRNMVTSVLGPGIKDLNLNLRRGKLKKGEILILATDGLADNLYVKVHEGFVTDSSGTGDIAYLLGQERDPGKITRMFVKETAKRIKTGKIQQSERILVPKEDDITVAVFRFI